MRDEFFHIVEIDDPQRLDQVIAKHLSSLSRSKIQKLIQEGFVKVNTEIIKACKFRVVENDHIIMSYELSEEVSWQASAIELDILYEDQDILVIDKPAGLVMHPGAGQSDNTVANALLFINPLAHTIPRAGIVHRLDKDTSGVCICAKTIEAYQALVFAMQARQISRKYKALVHGEIFAPSSVAEPIGRHKRNRTAMAVVANGKEAKTYYEIISKYEKFTWLDISLETGRTHQIRVHMAHIKHPIAGDSLYNKAITQYAGISAATIAAIQQLNRQALHAYEISFLHPTSKKKVAFKAEIPNDISDVLETLTSKSFLD